MKKMLTLLVSLMMSVGLCISSSARAPNVVNPLWTNIASMSNSISFIGTEGHAYATVKGKTGTTAISATLTIYRQSGSDWIYVTSASDSTTNIRLSMGCDFAGIVGEYYKSVFEVAVTINGIDELETKISFGNCT